jgi:hypothetical protein
MPFAVSQWPYSPDPRPPDFGIAGFDFGAVPPWRWLMESTGALSPYDPLNAGMVWEAAFHTVDSMQFAPLVPLIGVDDQVLEFFGTQEPSGGPPGVTMFMQVRFENTGPLQQSGSRLLLYPPAIQVNGPFNMLNQGVPSVLIPNPIEITPVVFDFELP